MINLFRNQCKCGWKWGQITQSSNLWPKKVKEELEKVVFKVTKEPDDDSENLQSHLVDMALFGTTYDLPEGRENLEQVLSQADEEISEYTKQSVKTEFFRGKREFFQKIYSFVRKNRVIQKKYSFHKNPCFSRWFEKKPASSKSTCIEVRGLCKKCSLQCLN